MKKEEEQVIPSFDEECFGEHGRYDFCDTCLLKAKCKRFTNVEHQVSIRHKGKYSSRGKEKGRDRY